MTRHHWKFVRELRDYAPGDFGWECERCKVATTRKGTMGPPERDEFGNQMDDCDFVTVKKVLDE